jgi:hypothetical protein
MARHERDVAKEGLWRDVVARQTVSGLSVRAFCSREQLRESAFYAWRRTIRERDGDVQRASPAFVPAVIKPGGQKDASFTLELAGGHVLRMPGISVEQLADFVAALEERSPR